MSALFFVFIEFFNQFHDWIFINIAGFRSSLEYFIAEYTTKMNKNIKNIEMKLFILYNDNYNREKNID